jgi:hypothetical protein
MAFLHDSNEKAGCVATIVLFGVVLFAMVAPIPSGFKIGALVLALVLVPFVYASARDKFQGH